MSVRPPAVAGQFYPDDKDELYEQIHMAFTHPLGPGRFPSSNGAIEGSISRFGCLIVPHAGYIYSGPIAAHSYNLVYKFLHNFGNEERIIVIILGPNHYGIGSGIALSDSLQWQTPLGEINVAVDLGKKLAARSTIIDVNELAHSREHSIEVQVPFIQAMAGSLTKKVWIMPICMMLQDMETAVEVADDLFALIEDEKKNYPILILASSDLTHYEPQERAKLKDQELLAEVEKLRVSAFYNVLERKNVSACGYGPIAAVMHISKKLQKNKGHILKYATSGEISGDLSSVVGYSAVHIVE